MTVRRVGDNQALSVTPDRKILAWVTFTGTGTPAIYDGDQVSSITDNAVGRWTVTWSQAISRSTAYVVMGLGRRIGNVPTNTGIASVDPLSYLTATSVDMRFVESGANTLVDSPYMSCIAVGAAP